MFWISLIAFLISVIGFIYTFTCFIDLTSRMNIKVQDDDISLIKKFKKEVKEYRGIIEK